jgi:PAS domain S-box-containing protein
MQFDHLIFHHDSFWIISALVTGVLTFLLWNRQQTLASLKRYQEKLYESQAHLAAILDSSPESAALMDENGIIIATNQVFGQRLGYDSATLIGQCAYDLIPPELVEKRKAHLAHALRTGQPVHFEDQRGERWISHRLQPIRDADGIARRVAVFGADITERKQAEEKLRQSEANLLALFENTDDSIVSRDREGRAILFNHGFVEIVKRVFGVEATLGIRTTDYLPEAHKAYWEKILDKTLKGESHREVFPWDFDGDTRYYELSLNPIRGAGNTIIGSTEYTRDITDRKRMEDEVRHALAEKETLLREVHHRVKNNLASIIGLLELQQSRQTESDNIALLAELGNRIRSMALVHEMLYQSGTLAWIDFSAYLRALVGNLCDAFKSDGDIEVKVIADKVLMDLEVAIPCGLIVNELVVNAFKYAFPDHQPRSGANACEISITISQDNAAYHLMVADNGVGLPDDVDWKTTQSLGLQLVRMLGRHQLQGQLELDRSHGVCFSLRFCSKRPTPAE